MVLRSFQSCPPNGPALQQRGPRRGMTLRSDERDATYLRGQILQLRCNRFLTAVLLGDLLKLGLAALRKPADVGDVTTLKLIRLAPFLNDLALPFCSFCALGNLSGFWFRGVFLSPD